MIAALATSLLGQIAGPSGTAGPSSPAIPQPGPNQTANPQQGRVPGRHHLSSDMQATLLQLQSSQATPATVQTDDTGQSVGDVG